jgi:uncharacterized membrane protein
MEVITIAKNTQSHSKMTRSLQKLALTAHITTSVGWFGAIAGFLALALAGVMSRNADTVRAVYLSMELIAWFVIVPLSLASPLTGVIQSFSSSWGLFRHYWVLAKFLMTVPCTVILLVHLQPIGRLAKAAAGTTFSQSTLRDDRIQLIANAVAACVVLIVATSLSVFKPRGLTAYGLRLQNQKVLTAAPDAKLVAPRTPAWASLLAKLALILLAVFLVLHLFGFGLGGHH